MTHKFLSTIVVDVPFGLSAMRNGDSNTVQLSWSAPASNTPQVAGYEVFFGESGSDNTQSGGTSTGTTINVTPPSLNATYDFFVVAFSDAPYSLPSARSQAITIDPSEFYCFKVVPPSSLVVLKYNFNVMCTICIQFLPCCAIVFRVL